jgi:hypothetical protein
MDARRAAELAAHNAYGQLVAYLTAQTRDVMTAEDALGDAFLAALNLSIRESCYQIRPSAMSQLDFRVDRGEFTSSIIDLHLPIDTPLGIVDIA